MLSSSHLCASSFDISDISRVISIVENAAAPRKGSTEKEDNVATVTITTPSNDVEMGDAIAVDNFPIASTRLAGTTVGRDASAARRHHYSHSSISSSSTRSSQSEGSASSSSSGLVTSSVPTTDSSGNGSSSKLDDHHHREYSRRHLAKHHVHDGGHRWLQAESFNFDALETTFRPSRLPALLQIASESRRLRSLTHASWALDSHRVIYPTKPMLARDLEHRSLSKLDLLGAAALRFHAARRLHTRWPHASVDDLDGVLGVLLSDSVLGRIGKHYDLHVHARIGVSQLRQAPIRQTQRFAAQLFRAHVGALAEQAYERGGVRKLDAWLDEVFDDAVFPDLEELARRTNHPPSSAAVGKTSPEQHNSRIVPTRKRTRSASPPPLAINLRDDNEPRTKRSRSESISTTPCLKLENRHDVDCDTTATAINVGLLA